jgi:hypothetical protein
MKELRRHLQEVVDTRFGGVARQASLAAGVNQNAVGNILNGVTKLPDLDTLDAFATAFEWDLMDVVYWALQRDLPADPDPLVTIAQQLARLPIHEGQRNAIMVVIRQFVGDPGWPAASPC